MRLSKQESRRRWREIRDLWRQWDPIGVMSDPDRPSDEYDNYLGPCLRLLEKDASIQEITEYLAYIIGEYIGLDQTGIDYSKPEDFANKLKIWYSENWPNTHV